VLLEHLGERVVLGQRAGVVALRDVEPTSRAIAATVRGLSPEMMRMPTPCARK
jgi:hypothetical protein